MDIKIFEQAITDISFYFGVVSGVFILFLTVCFVFVSDRILFKSDCDYSDKKKFMIDVIASILFPIVIGVVFLAIAFAVLHIMF